MPTGRALPQPVAVPIRAATEAPALATGADKPFRPAGPLQRPRAGGLAAVLIKEPGQRQPGLELDTIHGHGRQPPPDGRPASATCVAQGATWLNFGANQEAGSGSRRPRRYQSPPPQRAGSVNIRIAGQLIPAQRSKSTSARNRHGWPHQARKNRSKACCIWHRPFRSCWTSWLADKGAQDRTQDPRSARSA